MLSIIQSKILYTKAERLLIKVYGQGSYEHEKFTSTHFTPMIWNLDDEEEERRIAIQRCSDGLRSCKSKEEEQG